MAAIGREIGTNKMRKPAAGYANAGNYRRRPSSRNAFRTNENAGDGWRLLG